MKPAIDRLLRTLLGADLPMRRQLIYWAVTVGLYLINFILFQWQAVPGLFGLMVDNWLLWWNLTGALVFYGLIRASDRLNIASLELVHAQTAFAIVAFIAAYVLSGSMRGATLTLLLTVMSCGTLILTTRQANFLNGLAVFLLAIVSLGMYRLDAAAFPLQTGLMHIAIATGIAILLALVAGHFNRLLHRLVRQKEELSEILTRIQLLATHDDLTGLPNRAHMRSLLAREAQRHNREGQTLCLAMLDLDLFKRVNDSYGHMIGDKVLSKFAHHASAALRGTDVLARWGGEEFCLLMPNTNLQAGIRVLERMRSQIATLDLSQIDSGLQITFSAGLAALGQNETMSDAIERADKALYQAKAAGRNTVRFFDADMEAAVTARLQLESELNDALREHQFAVCYQPQVDANGETTGVEALVRWQHPQRGIIYPAEFIPVTEESGLIVPLGYWVLEVAFRQLARWALRPETAHLTISVNVSVRQFRHLDFLRRVLSMIDQHGINPRRLKLELTESMLVENIEDTIAKMSVLKSRGVSFSLDDFGTGYSSLAYLKRLPIDELKIDKSFVREVLTDANDAVIACSIVALAHSLGLAVIAEGVETEGQRNFLIQNGCHHFQGLLFSEALAAEQCESFVGRQRLHAVARVASGSSVIGLPTLR